MAENKNSLLIVDDENTNIKILTYILGPDYVIFTASNGTEAIEKAIEYSPDLILLDIIMPGMDGYETLSVIKNTEKIKKIPVIFITGLDSDEDEEKGLSLDAADYITKPFSPTVVKLRVRNQIQIVTQLRMIERLSFVDQLTGLPNRRSFDERLKMEWRLAIREKTPISIFMMDLDKFKLINDEYGHHNGDIVLKTVAELFRSVVKRPADFISRWGGEEFVVLLPNTPLESAIEVAENIRLAVESAVIRKDNSPVMKITISIGINSLIPVLNSSLELFTSNADKELYNAKASGRNRVSYHSGIN